MPSDHEAGTCKGQPECEECLSMFIDALAEEYDHELKQMTERENHDGRSTK